MFLGGAFLCLLLWSRCDHGIDLEYKEYHRPPVLESKRQWEAGSFGITNGTVFVSGPGYREPSLELQCRPGQWSAIAI